MKKIMAFLLAAGLSVSLFATDIFKYVPIKGNPKNYVKTEYTIASKFGNYFRTPSIKYLHTFNADGQEIESSELTPRDIPLNKITSTYDENNNLIEQTCLSSDGELIWKNIITYKNGLKVDSSEYNSKGTLKAKSIYTYEGNLLVDETGYDGEGALVWKTVYKYNAAGKIESSSDYNYDGVLDAAKVYAYSEEGLLDTITEFDGFSTATVKRVFRYDDNKLLSEITSYGKENQIIMRVLLKYDSANNVNKVSEYTIANKFGTTVNELTGMSEFVYEY